LEDFYVSVPFSIRAFNKSLGVGSFGGQSKNMIVKMGCPSAMMAPSWVYGLVA
jgi:hypothetical protein